MRKIYSSLIALSLMAFSSVAKAQYSATFDVDPIEDYVAGQKAVESADKVAEQLGLADAAALKTLITDSPAVYLKTDEGKTNAYTGGHNEFWLNVSGVPQGYYDEGTAWFVGLEYTETDSINVYVGQMPGVFAKVYEPSALSATLLLVNEDKEVTFDLTQNITAAEPPALPAPEVKLSNLDIVKEYELQLTFTEGKTSDASFSATFDGIYEALGVTPDEIDKNVRDYVQAQAVLKEDIGGEASYTLADSLTQVYPGSYDGWFGRYSTLNEQDEEVPVEINAPHGWGADATFYIHDVALAEGEFSVTSGQYVGTMALGTADSTYFYIQNGAKAVKVKVTATVIPQEYIDPNDFVLVGDTTVAISAEIDNNYATKGFTIDVESIAAKLGCTTADFDDVYAWGGENQMSDNHTEGSGGFYFAADGYIASWGSGSAFFVARSTTSLEDGAFTIGQMSGAFTNITADSTVVADLIFKHELNYYLVHVQYTVKVPAEKPEDFTFTKVTTEVLDVNLVPDTENYAIGTSSFDLDYIKSKIGTDDFKLYTDVWVDSIQALAWSDNYTCTPAPGFWYGQQTYKDADGKDVVQNAGWGTNSFGFTYATGGTITWYNFPGQSNAGDAWKANVYLVNNETGDYIQYVFNVEYAAEPGKELETVLTYNELVALPEDNIIAINIDTITGALGITKQELIENIEWKFNKSLSTFDLSHDGSNYFLSADGYVSPMGSDEQPAGTVGLYTAFAEDEVSVEVAPSTDLPFVTGDESEVIIRMVFDDPAQNKRVVYVITVVSAESEKIVGIDAVGAAAKKGARFNLVGQPVGADYKGIVIENGKKLLVK